MDPTRFFDLYPLLSERSQDPPNQRSSHFAGNGAEYRNGSELALRRKDESAFHDFDFRRSIGTQSMLDAVAQLIQNVLRQIRRILGDEIDSDTLEDGTEKAPVSNNSRKNRNLTV